MVVLGQPRMSQRHGKCCFCLFVLSIVAHRIHERILGRIKDLNLIPDSSVAWNRQEYTIPVLKLSRIHSNVEDSQKPGVFDFSPSVLHNCHQLAFII